MQLHDSFLGYTIASIKLIYIYKIFLSLQKTFLGDNIVSIHISGDYFIQDAVESSKYIYIHIHI